MKKYIISLIFLFISCPDDLGKQAPIGDEFEDLWHKIEFNKPIIKIEPSKVNSKGFYILAEKNIYFFNDSIKMILSFNGAHELTTLSSSFLSPERLLVGTDNGYIYYCNMVEVLLEIDFQFLGGIKFLSFSPFDTSTIFISNDYLLLKFSLPGNDFDTLFYNSKKIVMILVQQSGVIYLATGDILYRSTNQGQQWDTLYISIEGFINGIAFDENKKLYLSIENRILKSQDGINWIGLYNAPYRTFSIAGIEDGLILAHSNRNDVDVYKLKPDGKIYDISLGIIHNFSYLSDLPVMIAVNKNRYLISFRGADENESALLHFFDTILPP